MRLTIVQYAGDYREAYERFAAGGRATYQAQRYSVNFVGSLASRLDQVAVVCLTGPEAYDHVLGNGVRAVCAGLANGFEGAAAIPALAATAPDRLVLSTPIRQIFRWARTRQIRTIAPLADSFAANDLRQWLQVWRLARELRAHGVEWVANHGLNACLSLLSIGVPPDKIIPWDWPPSFSPHDRPARVRDRAGVALVYVGGIGETKGVGDLIDAVAALHRQGRPVSATLYGRDGEGFAAGRVAALGLADIVLLPGQIANEDVPEAMRAADIVVVPSRHEYPEGLPLTIYEALSSRTPVVASDHPMFRGAIRDGDSAIVFRAGDPGGLAAAIARLADDPALYARLSINGAAAWDALQLPVSWGALLERWVSDTAEDRRWLAQHAVASGLYDERLAQRRAAIAQ